MIGWIFLLLGFPAILDVRIWGGHGWTTGDLWLVAAIYLMVHLRMSSWGLVTTAFKLTFFKIQWTLLVFAGVLVMWKVSLHSPVLLVLGFPGFSASLSYWCFAKKVQGLAIVSPKTATSGLNHIGLR